jgi:hypothetical protein
MSLWRYMLDSEYKQRDDIDAAGDAAAAAASAAEQSRHVARISEQRIERLELLLETLLHHLEQSGQLDRERFARLVEQVDLADGYLDGRVSPDMSRHAPKCQQCGKPLARKRKQCVYCGAEVTGRRR